MTKEQIEQAAKEWADSNHNVYIRLGNHTTAQMAFLAGSRYQSQSAVPGDVKILVDALNRITRVEHSQGREGCTWGDTDYDSMSAATGYNQAIDNVKDIAEEALSSYQSSSNAEQKEDIEVKGFLAGSKYKEWAVDKIQKEYEELAAAHMKLADEYSKLFQQNKLQQESAAITAGEQMKEHAAAFANYIREFQVSEFGLWENSKGEVLTTSELYDLWPERNQSPESLPAEGDAVEFARWINTLGLSFHNNAIWTIPNGKWFDDHKYFDPTILRYTTEQLYSLFKGTPLIEKPNFGKHLGGEMMDVANKTFSRLASDTPTSIETEKPQEPKPPIWGRAL